MPDRTDGATRLYSWQHIDRLKVILHLADKGFSLKIIGLIRNTGQTCTTGMKVVKKYQELLIVQ